MNFLSSCIMRFLVVIFQCLCMSMVNSSGLGSCKSSSFSRSIGYILVGFMLGEVEVGNILECNTRCIISANCVSVNIISSADGRLICHLNSGRMENAFLGQFVPYQTGEYYGFEVKGAMFAESLRRPAPKLRLLSQPHLTLPSFSRNNMSEFYLT